MRKITLPILLLLAGLLFLPLPARAQNEGDIIVGGELLFRIRVGAEGKTVKQRVAEVEDRLPIILGANQILPGDITTAKAGKSVKIMVKKQLLVTCTPEDGKPNSLSANAQAQIWVKQLRRILPQINASPNLNNRQS